MAKEDFFYVDQISVIDAAATDAVSLDETIPEIWASRVLEFMQSRLVLGGLPQFQNTDLLNKPGDILHLPIFDQISTEAAAATEGSAAAITEITSSELTATPSTYKNAVELTDEMLERTNVVTFMDEAMRRLGYGMALKLEKDIRVKLEAAVNAGANAGQLVDKTGSQFAATFFADARRIIRKNAPNVQPNEFIAVVHPDHMIALEKDTQFVDASVYGSSTALLTGEIGKFLGIRMLVSDVGRQGAADFDSDATNDQDCWVLGPDAFRVVWKRKPQVKTQYFAREGYTDVVGSAGWAVTKYRVEHIVRIVADVAP
jgi:N4-gp56 family major capsid protein